MSMVTLPGLAEMIDGISRERNLPKTAVQEALREALLKGYERYRRTQRMDMHFEETYFDNFEVELDPEDGGFRVLATKSIVDDVIVPDHEIALQEVQEVAAEAQLGDTVVLDVTPEKDDFGRMAAIQTKQVLSQKLRDLQRKLIQEEFQDLEGEVLQARVLRFENQSVVMAVSSGFGQAEVEADLPKREQLPNDNYRANATFKVFLKKVCDGPQRGSQLVVSRADAGLVVYLFENEVPEIEDEVVRVVAVAREANPPSRHVGPRTKIAVDTIESDVDPVGACIGARGSRIQVVVNELRGEKIDVIRWSPDPGIYISNALSPARVDEVRLIDPDLRQAHVLVPENQLSLAIGKEGQNVRLAARLTGWKIDIKDSGQYDEAEYEALVAEAQAKAAARAEQEAAEAAALEAAEAEAAALEAELEAAEAEAAELEAAELEAAEAAELDASEPETVELEPFELADVDAEIPEESDEADNLDVDDLDAEPSEELGEVEADATIEATGAINESLIVSVAATDPTEAFDRTVEPVVDAPIDAINSTETADEPAISPDPAELIEAVAIATESEGSPPAELEMELEVETEAIEPREPIAATAETVPETEPEPETKPELEPAAANTSDAPPANVSADVSGDVHPHLDNDVEDAIASDSHTPERAPNPEDAADAIE